MILRKYGSAYQSVDVNFDSKALNEVGFRRNHQRSVSVDAFESEYRQVEAVALEATAEGDVQDFTEQAMLDKLEQQLEELEKRLAPGEVLVVENEQGHDYPKTRQVTSNVIVEGENRLRFSYSVAPPLRVGRYVPRG